MEENEVALQKQNRNSAVELLRILCIFMVVVLHFNGRCINSDLWNIQGPLTMRNGIGHVVYSFCIMAVDCFVLISGYFGIRFNVKKLFRLYLQCFCWGVIGYILYCVLMQSPMNISALLGRLFAFSHNHWWFVNVYVFLFFTAPILNAALDYVTCKRLREYMGIFSIAIFYFGFCRNMEVPDAAQTYLLFMYLYCLGTWLRRECTTDFIRRNKKYWLIGYMLCVGVIFVLAILNQKYLHLSVFWLQPYTYVSPVVILGAVLLLLLFLSFNFHSKFVNVCATSVFAAYLLQDNIYFGFSYLYPLVSMIFSYHGIIMSYFLLPIISFAFIIGVVFADQILRLVIYQPCLTLYDVIRDRLINDAKHSNIANYI